jgi:hypothetical protein
MYLTSQKYEKELLNLTLAVHQTILDNQHRNRHLQIRQFSTIGDVSEVLLSTFLFRFDTSKTKPNLLTNSAND